MPIISVVIPVYNGEKYIRKCIESVLLQKNFDSYEIIVVNNGSTDNTLQLCKEMADCYDKIHIIHLETPGVSHARNMGIDASQGKYILFLDADDYLDKNCMEIAYNNAQIYDADIVAFNINHVYAGHNRKDVLGRKNDGKVVWYDNRRLAKFNLDMAETYMCNNATKLYKRKLVKLYDIRFNETMSLGEDLFFNLDCCEVAESYVYINQSMYNYIVHSGGSLNRKYRADMLDIKMNMHERKKAYFSKYGLWDRRWLRGYYVSFLNEVFACILNFVRTPKEQRGLSGGATLKEIVNHPCVRECCHYEIYHFLPITKKIFLFALRYKLGFLLRMMCAVYKKKSDWMT